MIENKIKCFFGFHKYSIDAPSEAEEKFFDAINSAKPGEYIEVNLSDYYKVCDWCSKKSKLKDGDFFRIINYYRQKHRFQQLANIASGKIKVQWAEGAKGCYGSYED